MDIGLLIRDVPCGRCDIDELACPVIFAATKRQADSVFNNVIQVIFSKPLKGFGFVCGFDVSTVGRFDFNRLAGFKFDLCYPHLDHELG